MLVLTFQVKFKTHLEPPEAVLQPDLENTFLCLILSGDHGDLQQYMWLCKLQSGLHVQHENKVLNTGLSVQVIATDLEIIQTSKSPSKSPCRKQKSGVSWYYLVTLKVTTQNLVALAVWVNIYLKPKVTLHFELLYISLLFSVYPT